jgi:hypothetical protein
MNGKTLYRETTYLRMFPDPSDVFANRVKKHSTFLLPVATVALRYLSRKWEGNIHFVMPIEPCGGYSFPGARMSGYHNYLCRPNWIGYRMLGDKCELACDFRFFHKAYYAENPPQTETARREAQEFQSHYFRTRQAFKRHTQFFREHGWLCQSPERWTGSKNDISLMRVSLVHDLGGVSFDRNWSKVGDLPISRYADQFEDRGIVYESDRVLPRTEDGRDFHYIGDVEMWNYIGDTNGVLVLFYDPKERIALTTIDWT